MAETAPIAEQPLRALCDHGSKPDHCVLCACRAYNRRLKVERAGAK